MAKIKKNTKLKLKAWQRGKNFGRLENNRGEGFKTFLIVCEGEKTEPQYFDAFKMRSVRVEVKGTGFNTHTLVQEAIRLKNLSQNEGSSYDQVWCVFDRDDFDPNHVTKAFGLAKANGVRIAYSNECFELWYVLHFDFHTAASRRDHYFAKLTKRLKSKYKKNSKEMYSLLQSKRIDAIRNAKRLMRTYKNYDPISSNPSTTVYQLVEELLRNES